jgi:A/G-specific adenine glycosylase
MESAAAPVLGPAWKRTLRRKLLLWYRRNRRDLPWRRTHDPYRIWVSEIMLQQTQVDTVVPYYHRFIKALPNVAALAAADEHDVLRLWEGLGYYRRARQLHRAAGDIVKRHAGRFPRSLEDVRQLPGIGRYTAGAILSIAYDQRAPILEANTIRVFARLVAMDADLGTTASQQTLWTVAETVLPRRNCRDFNQALMELGSLVCTPRSPRCDQCPLASVCESNRRGIQEQIPRRRAKLPSEDVLEASVAVRRRGDLLLRRRTSGERWAGLWDFLRFPLSARLGEARRRELVDSVRQQSGLAVQGLRSVATLKHGVTRFRITLECYTAESIAARPRLSPGEWRWVDPVELNSLPLSVTGRRFSRLLEEAAAAND